MRYLLLGSGTSAAAIMLSASLHAQNPPAKPVENPDPHKTVTLTGCLEASASLPGFRLKDAVTVESGGPPPAEAVPRGTSGKPVAVYELTAKEGVDLSTHAGQQVSITGTHVTTDEPASPALPATAEAPPPKFTVMSVKTLASSCS